MSENNGAETLYLMQAEIDLNHLNTWMGKRQVEHSGRAMHCLLTETLGDAAPSQFRVMSQRSRNAATLYGYTRHDAKQLIHNHRAFATPQQEQVMPADSMATKAMPDQWTDGTNLAFDVLCRPIRQRVKHEVDAFKSMQEAAPEADITRQEAYLRWLTEFFERRGTATVQNASVEQYRQSKTETAPQRTTANLPETIMKGVLKITDGEHFTQTLASGVGRHRTYGFGMLLIKPAIRQYAVSE